jgi:anti-sigma factor RsiW
MKCITSPALDDTQIISYVEGEADDAVVTHIKECPYCAERASRLTLFQNQLKTQLYRSTCPSSIELGDYYLGLLPASQVLVVAKHIRDCPHCRLEIAELEEFLAEADVHPDLLKTAKVLFARLVGGQAGEPSSTSAFSALRGEAKGPLVFEADGIVITLDVQASANQQVSIQGQLAADDQNQWTGAVVKLQQAGMPELTASLDDLGAFAFEAISPGSLELHITSPNGFEVQIPNLDLSL